MITGGVAWTTALNSEQKQPLYVFSIPGKSIYLGSFFPLDIITGGSSLLPILQIPQGASQSIDELNGHSSISSLQITAVDPSGALKSLAADTSVIGQICTLKMGFPGLALSDFVTIHAGTIASVGRSSSGVMTIQAQDLLLSLVNDIFMNGGPNSWVSGQVTNDPPVIPPAVLQNSKPISSNNPRYLSGNRMDLLLAILQNELGFGQSTPPALAVNTGGGSGTGQAGYGVNSLWRFYNINDSSTLINPNTYVDVTGIQTLRDTQFSGDRMEFTITSPQSGKSWTEDQILKVSGLYWITRANGQLALKSMKHPASVSPVTINANHIVGIPEVTRWPIVNMIQATMPATSTVRPDGGDQASISFVQQSSISTYKTPYVHTINSEGLRPGYGGFTSLFLLANRIFNRHAFGTPEYTFTPYLKNFVLELGDFIYLTHSLLLDLQTGVLGVTNVLCEITERQPDYTNGKIAFKAIDTRFISVPSGAFQIASSGAGIPVWGSATTLQKATYMFISDRNGLMSDSVAGNQVQ